MSYMVNPAARKQQRRVLDPEEAEFKSLLALGRARCAPVSTNRGQGGRPRAVRIGADTGTIEELRRAGIPLSILNSAMRRPLLQQEDFTERDRHEAKGLQRNATVCAVRMELVHAEIAPFGPDDASLRRGSNSQELKGLSVHMFSNAHLYTVEDEDKFAEVEVVARSSRDATLKDAIMGADDIMVSEMHTSSSSCQQKFKLLLSAIEPYTGGGLTEEGDIAFWEAISSGEKFLVIDREHWIDDEHRDHLESWDACAMVVRWDPGTEEFETFDMLSIDDPERHVAMVDRADFKEQVQQIMEVEGIEYCCAWGADCQGLGENFDAQRFVRNLLPDLPGWNKKPELWYNSFSLAMDVLRHAGLVPSTNKIYGKKHTAIRDCFDVLSVLELVLLEFE